MRIFSLGGKNNILIKKKSVSGTGSRTGTDSLMTLGDGPWDKWPLAKLRKLQSAKSHLYFISLCMVVGDANHCNRSV